MKWNLRALALFVFLLLPSMASAQCYMSAPLPVNTVIGRLGVTPGPCQAIPFATLLAAIGNVPNTRNINTTSPLTGGGNMTVDRTLACPTCVTSSAGGAITGTAPISVNSSGLVSINANGITNSLLAQGGAATIKGNPTGSTANDTDFTIQGLTNLPSPSPTLDFLICYDHVSGTLKNCTPTAIVGSTSGTVTSITCAGATITTTGICPPSYGFQNCSIAASVTSNNLTVSLKDNAGSDPTATSPCNVWFRSSTAATGSWVQRTVTAATSFVANASSTFGISNTAGQCSAASSCPFRLWVMLVDTGSTAVLGVVALTNASGVLPLNEAGLFTTTACNACATATALGTMYTTATQTTRPIAILGYMDWGSGLATAGTYASGPTLIQSMGPGIRKPGESIQDLYASSTTPTTGSGTTNVATVPSISITPTASPNIIKVTASGTVQAGTTDPVVQIFRAAGGSAACTTGVGAVHIPNVGSGSGTSETPFGLDAPGTSSQQTYVVCIKSVTATNALYCSNTQATQTCVIEVWEIMGALRENFYDNDNDPQLLNKVG